MGGGRGRGALIAGASEVATLAGGLRRGPAQDDPAVAPPGTAVACLDGRIVEVGPVAAAREALAAALEASGGSAVDIEEIDATGGTVTPGLVDSHTHLLFGGSREREVQLRQRGATYLEILAAGGGILSTVAATRAASDEVLLAHGRRWLAEMRRQGTTTVEAKSGYGLDAATELRLLGLLARLGAEGPLDVLPTFLGAHAVPAEVRAAHPGDPAGAAEAYVAAVIETQLPAVAAQGYARFADVFCETGVFTPGQARRVLVAARELGIAVRLHADELTPSGGAELGAELGACSVDHLAAPSPAGIAALAAAADAGRPVIATLLPTVGWFLGLAPTEPARELIASGIPIALATDFNPGTSPIAGLPLVMTTAVLGLRMTPGEALAATTVNAAAALLLDDRGMLVPGMRADIVIWNVPTHAQIPYWAGAELARQVLTGRPPTAPESQPDPAGTHAGAPPTGASTQLAGEHA
jgi:imidazolonepropionase